MSFALSFVPLKSTKMAQYKRFMEKPSFFTGQISTFAPDKTMFRKGLYGSEVLLDIFSLGFVPFLSRQTSTEKKQNMEVVDNKCVAKAKISKNAVTTSKHQKCLYCFSCSYGCWQFWMSVHRNTREVAKRMCPTRCGMAASRVACPLG